MLEADFLRYYNLDLPRQLGTPRLTWRRLGVLIRHLPPEAATVRAMVGPAADWSQHLELLAGVYDRLGQQIWQAGGKASAPRPKPFTRPGGPVNRSALTPAEVAARLADLKARDSRRRNT